MMTPTIISAVPVKCVIPQLAGTISRPEYRRIKYGINPTTTPGCKIVKNKLRINKETIVLL